MKHISTILIVDDEPAGREILQELLIGLREEYNLAFASNGAEALARAAELIPDLILLDVMMPGMDGFEVCRRLRADSLLAEVPIIMVTALDDRDSRLQGIKAGADDFVSKPYDQDELGARVRTITRLNRYRQLLEVNRQLENDIAQLSTLYDISRGLNYITDMDALLRLIVRQTKRVLNAKGSSIIFHDQEKDELYFRAVAMEDDEIAARLKQLRFPADSSIAGWVFREGEPALVQDVGTDTRFCRELDRNIGFTTKSVLCIPLHGKKGVIGVLEVVNKKGWGAKGWEFTEDDQNMLEAIADNIAVSIERADLYQDLQEAEKLLREQNEEVSRTVKSLGKAYKALSKIHAVRPESERSDWRTSIIKRLRSEAWANERTLPLILSFIYCGLGQIYKGKRLKGISFAVVYSLLIVPFFFSSPFPSSLHCFALLLMWFMGMTDVYVDDQIASRAKQPWRWKGLWNILRITAISTVLIILLGVTAYSTLTNTRLINRRPASVQSSGVELTSVQPTRDLEFLSVQVAAFAKMEKAKRVCDELLSTGHPSRIEHTTSGQRDWYRVLVGEFHEEQDAISFAEELYDQNDHSYMIVRYRGTERTGIFKAQF